MTGRELAFAACLLGWGASACAFAEPATAPSRAETAFSEMAGKTGDDYLAARARFLAMDKSTTASYLEAKRAGATDQVESLWLQALLARVRDPERLDKALADAIAEAGKERGPGPGGSPVPPMPAAGARLLLQRLGDDAAPLVTELFTKGLMDGWVPWKREIPLWTLDFLGSRPTRWGRPRAPVRDWRAGWVLLWTAEHEKDEGIADDARRALQDFPSEELIAAVESLVQHTKSDVVKRRFRDTPRFLRRLKDIADAQAGRTAPTAGLRDQGGLPMTRPAAKSDWIELPVGPASRPATQTAPTSSTRPASEPAP
jgi:hypothetical protein